MKRKLFLFLATCAFAGLAGCTRTMYVPVNNDVVRTEYRDRVRADSVFVRDSVYIRERGDTVYIYKDRLLYRDKLVRDTIVVRDSVVREVPYPVPGETKIVKHIPRVFRWSFALVMAGLVAGAVWLVLNVKKLPASLLGWAVKLFK